MPREKIKKLIMALLKEDGSLDVERINKLVDSVDDFLNRGGWVDAEDFLKKLDIK